MNNKKTCLERRPLRPPQPLPAALTVVQRMKNGCLLTKSTAEDLLTVAVSSYRFESATIRWSQCRSWIGQTQTDARNYRIIGGFQVVPRRDKMETSVESLDPETNGMLHYWGSLNWTDELHRTSTQLPSPTHADTSNLETRSWTGRLQRMECPGDPGPGRTAVECGGHKGPPRVPKHHRWR